MGAFLLYQGSVLRVSSSLSANTSSRLSMSLSGALHSRMLTDLRGGGAEGRHAGAGSACRQETLWQSDDGRGNPCRECCDSDGGWPGARFNALTKVAKHQS